MTPAGAPVEARRAAAARLVGPGTGAAARIAGAPAPYLLVHTSSDVARHGQLLTPLPAAGEVRLLVTPGRQAGHWHLDLASRDRAGLLAAFTGVLAGRGIGIVQAVVATWDDGGALQAFVVRSAAPPDEAVLQPALEASLGAAPRSAPVPDAEVEFVDTATGPYTYCTVRARDRPGLLHDIAGAMAAAGADVHAARVATIGQAAVDHFDLSDRRARKLTPSGQDAVRRAIRSGCCPT
jgi:[protein-PII] uridylyltransferase